MFINLNMVRGQMTIAEKLGYNKETKLLIINTDDLGVAHAENSASIKAIEVGVVRSGSIMMPTPWVREIAVYAHQNKGTHDLGIHLTLTSEWKNYRWGPVAPKDKVPTLTNDEGHLLEFCSRNFSPKDVEIELRAQIELAYKMGIDPTHLDSHMDCLFQLGEEIFMIYLKLAKEYGIPCRITKAFNLLVSNQQEFKQFIADNKEVFVMVDQNFTISPGEYQEGSAKLYISALKSMKPGLTQFLIHTAYDNPEMRAITVDHPNWGAAWRQTDFDFFMSDECRNIIEEENIKVTTWREIGEALKTKISSFDCTE